MIKRGYLVIMFIVIIFFSACAQKPTACTEEAKICPDGSAVGRIPPDCEFAECPEVPEDITEPETTIEESISEPVTPDEPEALIPETQVEEQGQIEAAPKEIDSSLIAHWKFDDTAMDSANNHHGTIMGGAEIKPGKIGNALYFDGVDDYVDIPSFEDIGSLTQGTIAFWFNYESLLDKQTVMPIFYMGIKDGSNSDNMYIIEIGHSANDGGTDLPNPNDKKIYSTWIKNHREPFVCFDSTNNVEENKWHHYAVVIGPDGNTGYLNGKEMTNRDYNFANANAKYFLSSIPVKEIFTLGYGRSSFMISPNFVYYKGLLDDVRIYDRPLTASEINEVMSG
jgi:hypothetical protein